MTTNNNQQELTQSIQELAYQLNRPPKMKEFERAKEVIEIWGSWTSAINQICKPKMIRKDLSEDILREEYEKQRQILGRRPKTTEYKYYHIVIQRYGAWRNWLKIVGDEKETTPENLIRELNEFYIKYNRSPRMTEVPHGGSIQQKIGKGNWNRALQVAGLLPIPEKSYTELQLILILKEKTKELGRSPFVRELPESSTIIRKFGSWKKALEAAGIKQEKREYNRRIVISDEDLFLKLQVLILNTQGRDPYYREFEHAGLIVKRFGKWSEVLKIAKRDPYKTLKKAEELTQNKRK